MYIDELFENDLKVNVVPEDGKFRPVIVKEYRGQVEPGRFTYARPGFRTVVRAELRDTEAEAETAGLKLAMMFIRAAARQ